MVYIKNLMRFLTFMTIALSMYSGGYIQAMQEERLLYEAIIKGDFGGVKYLVENKSDVNAQNFTHKTPLHKAVRCNNSRIEIVKYLVENKSDVNAQDEVLGTPLHVSIYKSKNNVPIEIVKCLIQNKADINIQYQTKTLWQYLVECYPQHITVFNESGVIDFRVEDCQGNTILDYSKGKECYNDILNLTRKLRTLEETQKVETLLRVLYVLRTKQSPVFKVPKPILIIIFKLVGIPTHGKSIKLFDC